MSIWFGAQMLTGTYSPVRMWSRSLGLAKMSLGTTSADMDSMMGWRPRFTSPPQSNVFRTSALPLMGINHGPLLQPPYFSFQKETFPLPLPHLTFSSLIAFFFSSSFFLLCFPFHYYGTFFVLFCQWLHAVVK
jgi:hypothetical protein